MFGRFRAIVLGAVHAALIFLLVLMLVAFTNDWEVTVFFNRYREAWVELAMVVFLVFAYPVVIFSLARQVWAHERDKKDADTD